MWNYPSKLLEFTNWAWNYIWSLLTSKFGQICAQITLIITYLLACLPVYRENVANCQISKTHFTLHLRFFKKWANHGLFLFIFDLFLQFQYKLKKRRWCAWDSNPGPQDGRRRRNHGAMAATRSFTFLLYESQIQSRALSSWGTRTYEIVRLEWRSDTHFIAFYAILTYSIRIRTKGCVYGGILMSISIRLE